MKTKIIISIICACSSLGIQAQGWEYVCSLTGEQLHKVCTQGADTVYVVGKNGLIAQSVDKGLTWDKRYVSGKETLNDIIFCNHETGFIVGNNGTILRTQNAGLSWEQMISGTTLNINAIAAFDLNNIWVIGSTWDVSAVRYISLIMHSTNIGETWITKPLLPDNLYLPDIKFKGDKGYITGQGGIVLKTEDKGMTWDEQILTKYYEIQSLSITENKVYALGDDEIVFTEDNENWYVSDNKIVSKATVYFQDDQKGFLTSYAFTTCGGCEFTFWIYKTIDGGNIWEEEFSGNNLYPGNFSFSLNNEFGYCVMDKYLIRTPYTGEFYSYDCPKQTGMNTIKSENQLTVSQIGKNQLLVKSESKPIKSASMFNISGIKVSTTNWINSVEEYGLDISNLPKGVYLIKVILSDNDMLFYKWIKR